MDKTSLGDRMKSFENLERRYVGKSDPVIIRVDGKAFHTYCRGFEKPYDMKFHSTMWDTAKYLCENIQNVQVAYVQSDEISLFVKGYGEEKTQLWFDGNIQKIASISAGIAVVGFNKSRMSSGLSDKWALFDARVFNIPKDEVVNYFIWRQQDCTRNTVQMVARNNFSQKKLQNMSCDVMSRLLRSEKEIDVDELPHRERRGVCILRETKEVEIDWAEIEKEKGIVLPAHVKKQRTAVRSFYTLDDDIPLFTEQRDYIESLV